MYQLFAVKVFCFISMKDLYILYNSLKKNDTSDTTFHIPLYCKALACIIFFSHLIPFPGFLRVSLAIQGFQAIFLYQIRYTDNDTKSEN